MKGPFLVAVFTTAACAAGFAKSGTFFEMSPSLSGISASAPRYTTENERLVSEIAGSILNIAAFADHFEPGDSFQVRSAAAAAGHAKFTLTRRAEVFTVEVPAHVWVPSSYARLARSFMADAADSALSVDPVQDHVALAGVLGGGLLVQNTRLSRLLAEHPRSAALHQRAALLLGAAAKERSGSDRRVLLSRMTAHLAVARALRQGPLDALDPLEVEGQLAERQLAALASAEVRAGMTSAAVGEIPDGPVSFGGTPRVVIVPEPAASR